MGPESAFVSGDSRSGCVANLKWIKHRQRGLLFALESNRPVSVEKGVRVPVQQLVVAEEGWVVWLAVVDLESGLLLGVAHNVPYFTSSYLEAVATVAVDMLRGKNVRAVESLLTNQRSKVVEK